MSSNLENQIVDKLDIGYIVIKKEKSSYVIEDINKQGLLILNRNKEYFIKKPLRVLQEVEPKIYQYIKTEVDYPSLSVKEYKLKENYRLYFLKIFWQEDKLIVTLRDASKQLESISTHEMLLTVMNDIVVVLNEDLIIKQLILNDEKYNIDKSTILNNSMFKLFNRVDLLKIEHYFKNAKKTFAVISFNYPITINNKPYWFDINIKYIKQLESNFYVVKMKDITPQYTNDRELINLDKRYQKIISLSNIGVWEYHSESGYLWCNEEYFSMLGYSKDKYIEESEFNIKSCWINLLHPDDKQKAVAEFNKFIEDVNEDTYESRFRLRKSDDSYAWIWSKSNKLINDQGLKSTIYIGTHLDVTKQKEAETLAKATKEQIRLLIDQMNQGYVLHEMILDEKGEPVDFVYLDMNDFFEEMAYHSKSQLIGKTASEVNPDTYKQMVRDYSEVALSNVVKKREYYSAKTDRYIRDIIFSPKKNQFAIVCEDITEGKLIELELKQSEQRFKSLLAEVDSIGVQGCDEDGLITYWNKASEKIYGYSESEAIGKNIYDLIIPKESADSIKKDMEKLFNGDKKVLTKELTLMRKDKSIVKVLSNHTIVEIHNKRKELFSLDVDLTERKEMEKLLHFEKEHFKTTLLSVGDGVIATDKNGKITLINTVAEELTGWKDGLAIGKNIFKVFNIIDQETKIQSKNPIEEVLEKEDIVDLKENTVLITKEGNEIPIEDSAAPIHNKDGEITGVVIVFRDYSEKKEQKEKIEYLSRHDNLTGLYNRHYTEFLTAKINNEENMPLAVFLIDINGLKLTNDAFGHAIGDKLLIKVAKILKECCRESDIIGRVGGDEFSIILPKTNKEIAERIQKRILQKSSETMVDSIAVSIAIGFEIKTDPKQRIDEIKSKAENEMYKSKLIYGKRMRLKTISTIIDSLHKKVDYEKKSSEQVADYAVKIGQKLGLDNTILADIKLAATLHDIGKIMIPEKILNKPGKLNINEFESIKKHSETGYHILRAVDEYVHIADSVLHHHERWDGNGYPRKLRGDEIPLIARIISVADAYEAITSYRPYQGSKNKEEAVKELIANSGKQFDPYIVEVFIESVIDSNDSN